MAFLRGGWEKVRVNTVFGLHSPEEAPRRPTWEIGQNGLEAAIYKVDMEDATVAYIFCGPTP